MHQNKNQKHIPVLLDTVLQYLDPQTGESYLDLTAGYGGHARAVLERTNAPDKAVLIDRDQNAARHLQQEFADRKVEILNQDFLTASQELLSSGRKFDVILADLGVSSPHLDMASRGFSIRLEGPLDMRMDRRQTLTAETIVNNSSEADLTRIFRLYGEEHRGIKIARAIIANRPVTTTAQLATIVASATTKRKPGYNKIHPATKVFQALRIAVNSELTQLEQALPLWTNLLNPNGRLAVISFHSLEDRIVKKYFVDQSREPYDAALRLPTKQPVTGDESELVFNPRARSAKLRAVVKINNKKERGD